MKYVLATLVVTALVLAPAAAAKGPSAATLDGPDGTAITFGGDGESGGTPLGDLTQQAGFFPAVFGQQPNPMLRSRPNGDLGPKYTITYDVPGPSGEVDRIRQDVYPYAKPSPVTYMEPGQKVFDMTTRGGWFRATPALKKTLVAAGLPDVSSGSAGASTPRTELVALVGAVAALALATAALLRRRARPAAAA